MLGFWFKFRKLKQVFDSKALKPYLVKSKGMVNGDFAMDGWSKNKS